jgi:hypothetical protein
MDLAQLEEGPPFWTLLLHLLNAFHTTPERFSYHSCGIEQNVATAPDILRSHAQVFNQSISGAVWCGGLGFGGCGAYVWLRWLPKRFVFVTSLFSPLLVTLIVLSLFLCHWQCNT